MKISYSPIAPKHPELGDLWYEIDVDHIGVWCPCGRHWEGQTWFNPETEITLVFRHGGWEKKYGPIYLNKKKVEE